MADRIFGAIRDAGTQVREREAERSIVPGQLGSTVFVGVFERGIERDITFCPSNKARRRKMGGVLDPADFNAISFASIEAPLQSKHFYDHSEGAGYLVNLRVTPTTNDASNDDRVDKAQLDVFNREDAPKYLGYLEAENGGRWAGQREEFLGSISGTPGTDFSPVNTIQLDGMSALDWKRDEWKGATVHLHGITTRTYTVVSNSSDGLITLAADEDLVTDWAAAGPPSDYMVTVYRDNLNYRGQEKVLTAEFKNGGIDPTLYFGLQIRVDGDVLLDYENLSMDTNSPYYWEDVINNDRNNDLFTVTDSFTGGRTVASARPANRYGLSKTLTANVLTLDDPFIYSTSVGVGAWVPTLTLVTLGDDVVPQVVTIECTDDTVDAEIFSVTTSLGNRTSTITCGAGDLATGIAHTTDDYMFDFTLTTGSGTVTVGDTITVYVRVLRVNELVGGKVVPDTTANKIYTIVSNTRSTVTVTATADLTDGGTLSGGEAFRLQWPERMGGGYDGYIAGMTTDDYEPLFDAATSPLKKLKTMNLGLVKLAIPGIAKPSDAVALQQKARDLALAYNWQYRVEFPDSILTEEDAATWINDTYGRLDLTVTFFPTFDYIRDPFADSGSEARDMLISKNGMHLGREAKIANDYEGYHKAEAGTDVTFPLIIRSTVLGRPDKNGAVRLDGEKLNPLGINTYRWSSDGSGLIAWGDRTLDNTTKFRFKHKREQLSHYTNVMLENFDWAIFKLNDPISDSDVLASMHSFFLKEYRKRALRGDSFTKGSNPAAIIKMDSENNTNATREAGDQHIDISLRFADVVERLKISIGAMGIMEID